MISLITIIICLLSVLLGKKLFDKWINHISIYALNWSMFVLLYELRLMNYVEITNHAWIVMLVAYFSFLLGIITIYNARKLNTVTVPYENIYKTKLEFLFKDEAKLIKYFAFITSTIGIFGTLYNWNILIKKFGSIASVFIQSNLLYRMRIDQEIKGLLPYIEVFLFVGIVLITIYMSYNNKFSFIILIPLLGIVLQGIANAGRANILLAFFMFVFTLLFSRNFFLTKKTESKTSRSRLIIILFIITIIAVSGLTVIKSFRGTIESFSASTRKLNKFRNSLLISPSIYLYLSSDIVVLSKYLEDDSVNKQFGESTFISVYNFLAKFDVVQRPTFYPKGYYIPMWTNTATYLRQVHEDFGYSGIFLFPFLLGLFVTFFWNKLYFEHNFYFLIPLVFFVVLIAYSTIVMVTVLPSWSFSLVISLITLKIVEKINLMKHNGKI